MAHRDRKLDELPKKAVILHRGGSATGRSAEETVRAAIVTLNGASFGEFTPTNAISDLRGKGFTVLNICHLEAAELYLEQLQANGLVATLSDPDKIPGSA